MTVEKSANPKSIIEFKFGRKHYAFSPRPLATLATVIALPLLLMLGFWQLHRADVKREILALYHTNSAALPTMVYSTINEPLPAPFQHIAVRGHFAPDQQILLDNRFNEHQVGYQVITPFKLEDSNTYLLINRGWTPRHRNRAVMPTFETPDQKEIVTLSGYVSYPSQHNFVLGQNVEPLKNGLNVAQNLELAEMSEVVQHPVYPFVLLLDEKENYGFTREWNPVTMSPDIHMGYAVQWFALAASLLIIYLVVNLKARELHD